MYLEAQLIRLPLASNSDNLLILFEWVILIKVDLRFFHDIWRRSVHSRVVVPVNKRCDGRIVGVLSCAIKRFLSIIRDSVCVSGYPHNFAKGISCNEFATQNIYFIEQ